MSSIKRRVVNADDPTMTNSDFEATWVPRIGADATAELRRLRNFSLVGFWLLPTLAVTTSLLFENGALEDLLAILACGAGIRLLVEFARRQNRLAAAVSLWFGVRIAAARLPLMYPGRFDAWREHFELHGPAAAHDASQLLPPLRSNDEHSWGPIRWSGPTRRRQS